LPLIPIWAQGTQIHPILAVDFSADGKLVANSDNDQIRIWETSTGNLLQTLSAHEMVGALAFSSDGRLLVSGNTMWGGRSSKGPVQIWDVRTGRMLRRLQSPAGGINAIRFGTGGKTIIMGSVNGTAQIWDALSGKVLWKLPGTGGSWGNTAFSRDGRRMATARGHKVSFYDLARRKLTETLESSSLFVESIALSTDAKRLAVANSGSDNAVIVFDVASGKDIRTIYNLDGIPRTTALSPDGKTVASVGDNYLQMWDVNTGRLKYKLKSSGGVRQALLFSVDGQMIASGGDDGVLRLWSVATGKLRHELGKPATRISS
jgi:WD40 repeat protein